MEYLCAVSSQQPAFSRIVVLGSFERRRRKRLSDAAYQAFEAYIIETPDAGVVMPRTAGWRKVRWAETGQGKSGGVRVIYLHRSASGRIYLIDIYAKNEKSTLTRAEEQALVRLKATLE